MRWNIEVSHHDTKQFLDPEKCCKNTDYDALIAHVTVAVYIQYMFLAYRQRLKGRPKENGH